MKMPKDTSRNSAVSNALSSIRKDRRFPNKVLVGRWADYLFFEPFLMFNADFIDVKNILMIAEEASVLALVNLGNGIPIEHSNSQVLFIEQKKEAKEYISELESKGSPLSWRHLMDRYVCSSDKGNWSIYCEKENDVGVFAFREGFPHSVCSQVERSLKAKSIRFASSPRDTQSFDFEKLLPDWKSILVAEYVPTDIQ